MLNKVELKNIKTQGNDAIQSLIQESHDDKKILFILENLGRLPQDFDSNWVYDLLDNQNSKIRLHAVKTLGKAKQESAIEILFQMAKHDASTDVKREAVSALGRLKSKKTMTFLLEILNDSDPQVMIQAIRGLLVFKGDVQIDFTLKKLLHHENEFIQKMIQQEYFHQKKMIKDQLPHTQSYDYLKNVVVLGETQEILKKIPDESFHLTFTSPPYYNARDYSIYPSYQAYLCFLEVVFQLVYLKTKEGRFLIVNTSPVIMPRISRQHSSKRYPIPFDLHSILVKIGWEFIDDIIWLKPEASVKNRNASFLQHRKPLAYKPNARTEYLMVYRKQTDQLIDWNMKQYKDQIVEESKVENDYETSNVWEVDPVFNQIHSAVFPVELCQKVIKYYSFKWDLVFDPFAGSGTFGQTAKSLDRYFFLTEKNPEYFQYMQSCKKHSQELFDSRETQFLDSQEFFKKIR